MQYETKYLDWYRSYDTGTSSQTMFEVLTGIPAQRLGVPQDMADVGRCIRMLRLFPELRIRIGEVQERFISWRPYIDCWKQLESLYDDCIAFESLPEEQQKKLRKKKQTPHDHAWELCQKLHLVSQYLSGMRMQGNEYHLSNHPPKDY